MLESKSILSINNKVMTILAHLVVIVIATIWPAELVSVEAACKSINRGTTVCLQGPKNKLPSRS